jgi:hypothetical protein
MYEWHKQTTNSFPNNYFTPFSSPRNMDMKK